MTLGSDRFSTNRFFHRFLEAVKKLTNLTRVDRGCIGMTSAYQGMNMGLPENAPGTQCFATEAQARAHHCPPQQHKFIFSKQGPYAHGAPHPGPHGEVPNDTISSAGLFNYIVAFPGGCYGWMNFATVWATPGDPQLGSIGPVPPNGPRNLLHYPHHIWCTTCCSNCMKSQ